MDTFGQCSGFAGVLARLRIVSGAQGRPPRLMLVARPFMDTFWSVQRCCGSSGAPKNRIGGSGTIAQTPDGCSATKGHFWSAQHCCKSSGAPAKNRIGGSGTIAQICTCTVVPPRPLCPALSLGIHFGLPRSYDVGAGAFAWTPALGTVLIDPAPLLEWAVAHRSAFGLALAIYTLLCLQQLLCRKGTFASRAVPMRACRSYTGAGACSAR